MRSPLASWRKLPLPTPSRHQPSPPRHPLLPHGSSISSHGADAPFPWLSSSCRYPTRRPSVAGRASSLLLSPSSLSMSALPSDARRVAPWWLLASFPQRCQPRRAFTSHGRPGSPWSSSPCRIPFYGAWSSSLAAGRVSLAVGYSQHQPELAVIPQQTCGRR